jgi:hypothetical protein
MQSWSGLRRGHGIGSDPSAKPQADTAEEPNRDCAVGPGIRLGIVIDEVNGLDQAGESQPAQRRSEGCSALRFARRLSDCRLRRTPSSLPRTAPTTCGRRSSGFTRSRSAAAPTWTRARSRRSLGWWRRSCSRARCGFRNGRAMMIRGICQDPESRRRVYHGLRTPRALRIA